MIEVEKIEVLTQEADAVVAGGFVAGVVEGKPQLPGFFVADLQDGVELVFVRAVLQLQGRLLGRILVDDVEILEKKDLIEMLIEMAEAANARAELISGNTEEGDMLLRSFGGLAEVTNYRTF